jgi:hypothetical protein
LPICERLEPNSKVTVERFRHREKQCAEIKLTDDGIQIDESEEQPWKADDSIRASLESVSKVTVERLTQEKKE